MWKYAVASLLLWEDSPNQQEMISEKLNHLKAWVVSTKDQNQTDNAMAFRITKQTSLSNFVFQENETWTEMEIIEVEVATIMIIAVINAAAAFVDIYNRHLLA